MGGDGSGSAVTRLSPSPTEPVANELNSPPITTHVASVTTPTGIRMKEPLVSMTQAGASL